MRCSPTTSESPYERLQHAMLEIASLTVPPADGLYEVVRKHFEAKHKSRFKTLYPIVAPF